MEFEVVNKIFSAIKKELKEQGKELSLSDGEAAVFQFNNCMVYHDLYKNTPSKL